ncbi:hypothetical protein OIO90_003332 [Microbotryomycetes sp. JL221]|nr:hypothetical protein OIO90_003332 [Microbotryomycetes sp. JL221]
MPKAADPDRIPVSSASQLNQELQLLIDSLARDETEHTWEQIDKSLKRFHAVIRGGSARQFPDELVKGLKDKALVQGLTRSLISERTRLSGTALDLIAATTRLGSHFQSILSTYFPVVLRLLCRTNKLYIARASACVTSIILHTKLVDIVKFITQEWKSEAGKSSSFREKAAEAISCVLGCSTGGSKTTAAATTAQTGELQIDREQLEKRIEDLEWLIKHGATDRESKVRSEMKKCWDVYRVTWPERVASFTAPMTPIIRRYLNVTAPAPGAGMAAGTSSRNAAATVVKKPRVPSALSSSATAHSHSRSTAASASTSAVSTTSRSLSASTRAAAAPLASTVGSANLSKSTSATRSTSSRHAPTVVPASIPLPTSPKSNAYTDLGHRHPTLSSSANMPRQASSTSQSDITTMRVASHGSSSSLSRSASRPNDGDDVFSATMNVTSGRSVHAPPLPTLQSTDSTSAVDVVSLEGMKLTSSKPPPPSMTHASKRLEGPTVPTTTMPSHHARPTASSSSRPFKPTMSSSTATNGSTRTFMSSSMLNSTSSTNTNSTTTTTTEHRKARRVLTTISTVSTLPSIVSGPSMTSETVATMSSSIATPAQSQSVLNPTTTTQAGRVLSTTTTQVAPSGRSASRSNGGYAAATASTSSKVTAVPNPASSSSAPFRPRAHHQQLRDKDILNSIKNQNTNVKRTVIGAGVGDLAKTSRPTKSTLAVTPLSALVPSDSTLREEFPATESLSQQVELSEHELGQHSAKPVEIKFQHDIIVERIEKSSVEQFDPTSIQIDSTSKFDFDTQHENQMELTNEQLENKVAKTSESEESESQPVDNQEDLDEEHSPRIVQVEFEQPMEENLTEQSTVESQEIRVEIRMDTVELVSESQETSSNVFIEPQPEVGLDQENDVEQVEHDGECAFEIHGQELVENNVEEQETAVETNESELEIEPSVDTTVPLAAETKAAEGPVPEPDNNVESARCDDVATPTRMTARAVASPTVSVHLNEDLPSEAHRGTIELEAILAEEHEQDEDEKHEQDEEESGAEPVKESRADAITEQTMPSPTKVDDVTSTYSSTTTPTRPAPVRDIERAPLFPTLVDDDTLAPEHMADPDGDMDEFAQSCSIVLDTPPRVSIPVAGFIRLPAFNTAVPFESAIDSEVSNDEVWNEVQDEDDADDTTLNAEVDVDETGNFDNVLPLSLTYGQRDVFLADESAIQLVESSFDIVEESLDTVEGEGVLDEMTIDGEDAVQEFDVPLNDLSVASDSTQVAATQTEVDAVEVGEDVSRDESEDDGSSTVNDGEEQASTPTEGEFFGDNGTRSYASVIDDGDHPRGSAKDEDVDDDEDGFELEPDNRELVFHDESVISDESSIVDEDQFNEHNASHVDFVNVEEESRDDTSTMTGESTELRRSTRRQAQQQQQAPSYDDEGPAVLKRSLRSRVVTVDLNSSSSTTGVASLKSSLSRSTRSNARDVLSELQMQN